MNAVFELYIKATPERVWEAITNPEQRRIFNFGVGVQSDWTPGSAYTATAPSAPGPIAAGENLEVERPRRLVQTFRALWSENARLQGPSRVTWELAAVGDSCHLSVVHDQLPEGLADYRRSELTGGWPMVLSGLKTYVETGQPLTTPGSLMYAQPEGTEITNSTALSAPPARVWRALSDAKEFGEWFGVALTGPFVPGRETAGRILNPDYAHVPWRVTVQKMEAEKLFSYTWHPYAVDPKRDYSTEQPTLVEFRIEPAGGGSRLTVKESGFEGVAAERRDEAMRMHVGGWAAQMMNLARYVG